MYWTLRELDDPKEVPFSWRVVSRGIQRVAIPLYRKPKLQDRYLNIFTKNRVF